MLTIKTTIGNLFDSHCALDVYRTESEDASLALDLENLAQNIVIFKVKSFVEQLTISLN